MVENEQRETGFIDLAIVVGIISLLVILFEESEREAQGKPSVGVVNLGVWVERISGKEAHRGPSRAELDRKTVEGSAEAVAAVKVVLVVQVRGDTEPTLFAQSLGARGFLRRIEGDDRPGSEAGSGKREDEGEPEHSGIETAFRSVFKER